MAAVSALLISAFSPASDEVPVSRDLQQDGQAAVRQQLPVMLVFSATQCGYCRQLEMDFLEPMLLSGEYTGRVMIRKLLVDSGLPITGFDGSRMPPVELANRYHAYITPTILFLDGTGRELTERINGINTPELFGAYLEACIEVARQQLVDPAHPLIRSGCRALPVTSAAP